MTLIFITCLIVWGGFSVLRFFNMYDRESPLQRWRRWDWFRLVPVGAFFSPRVPPTEFWILVRDFLPDGRATRWAEVPRIRSRTWWHALWNPQKHLYRAKSESARAVIATAGQLLAESDRLPVTFLLSEPYFTIIRYVTNLPRLGRPQSTQFAVIETDLLTGKIVRSVVSSVHEI